SNILNQTLAFTERHYLLIVFFLLFYSSQAGTPDTSLAGRLNQHVSVLASDTLEGRGLGTKGTLRARKYISEAFNKIGLKSFNTGYFQHLDVRIQQAMVPATNIIGYLPGTDPGLKNEYIVLGAHYDHMGYRLENEERTIYYGADDNASGTAMLIELARYFAENPEARGRSMIFIAFDAEESGLLGSKHFVKNSGKFDREAIKAMVSLDMVGMYNNNNGLDLKGIGSLQHGRTLAENTAEETGLQLHKTTDRIPSATDTHPFGKQGIPAIHVFTGTHKRYHTPKDVCELLDYQGMASITKYMQSLVSKISFIPELNPSPQLEHQQESGKRPLKAGIIAHLGGSQHLYPQNFYKAKNVFAFSSGLFLRIDIGNRISLQPEILYDYNGSKTAEGTLRRHSLITPLNINYYLLRLKNRQNGIFLIAGGFYRRHFEGKEAARKIDFNIHPTEEWGINAGMGLNFSQFQISFIWRRGLNDLSGASNPKMISNGRFFSLGYSF
ncbi:MAG: M28 family peptidase, partial [Bacteroidales bacterium]